MGNGNGVLYRRGKAWTIGFTVNGRRVREAIGPNKHVAEMVLKKRISDALQGMYFPQKRNLGRMPFREFAEMYLERVVPLMKSIRTERTRVLRWIRHFGNRSLGQVTRVEIEHWRREKLAHCRPATINRDSARLRHMLNMAVEWELLEKSPMAGMKFLRENNARTRYLTVEECNRLIAACVAPHVRAICLVAIHAGLRLSEIFNLRWRHIDFFSDLLLIPDSKNGEPRYVPMDSALRSLLTNYPRRSNTEFIFTNANGDRLRNIRTGFKNARVRAGLNDLRFHDLRHSFADFWVSDGGNLYLLQNMLGHKTSRMTERYAHIAPEYRRKAIDRLDSIWNRPAQCETATDVVSESQSVTGASQTVLNTNPAPGEIL